MLHEIAVFFCGLTYIAGCQEMSADFKTISLGLQAAKNTERLHEFWEPEPGIDGFARMPFFEGNIQVGMQFIPFRRRLEDKPDFDSTTMYGQYDRELRLPYGFVWSLGGRLSMMKMRFFGSAADITGDMKNEREYGIGAVSRLSYPLHGRWCIHIEMCFTRIYTTRPIDVRVAGAGLSRTFDSPQWLQEFLW